MAGPIISVAELAAQMDDAALRVVDCRWYLGEPDRGRAAFDAGHLPHAVYASLDEHLSGTEGPGRHPLPHPDVFARSMAALGIDHSHRVVTYDDRGGAVAARLWWMLRAQGFARVHVLDGGITAWTAAGLPVTEIVGEPFRVEPFSSVPWTGIVTLDDVVSRAPANALVDVRAPERYRGDSEPVDARAGHIPGAISLPLTDNLDDSTRLLGASAIRDRFASAGIDGGTHVIAQCGSGVTACHLILAAEVAGLPSPDLYVGSWSEWSSTDRPVATGPTP